MPAPRNVRKYIEAADFDSVEGEWLAHFADQPDDLDFAVSVARLLKGAGAEDRATELLELLDESWSADGRWELRLELLEAVGELLDQPAGIYERIVECLEGLYAEFPSRQGLAEQVGLGKAVDDLAKTWEKVRRLRSLLAFEVGSVVSMKDKGAGRVLEVNMELESFKIDFEKSPGLRVGFNAAPKLLRSLPSNHILRRKLEQPEELLRLKREDPGGLLAATLESHDAPLTAGEIRDALSGVVEPSEWSSWWAAARRSASVLAEGRGARQRYRVVASASEAEGSILEAFERAGPHQRLELFRRHGERSPELRARMVASLIRAAARGAVKDPELAFAVWKALAPKDQPEAAPWAPQSLVATSPDPIALAVGIGDRSLREQAYRLILDLPDGMARLAEALEREEDPRLLDLLSESTATGGAALQSFLDLVVSQPRRLPAAFVWLAERLGSGGDLDGINPLRLLQHLLTAPGQSEFAAHRPRLKKLLEGNTVLPRLLERLAPEQAEAAEQALQRSHLEEYVRTPLLNALELRFPELRKATETPLYALAQSIETRRAELKKLREVEIPANRKAIQEARELGDLRENFEYKAARQRHEYLSARVASLENDLGRVRPIDLAREDSNEVRVASTVVLDGGQAARRITILGPWESDPDRDVVSYDSELGRSLLGARVGQRIELAGDELEISGIEPYTG